MEAIFLIGTDLTFSFDSWNDTHTRIKHTIIIHMFGNYHIIGNGVNTCNRFCVSQMMNTSITVTSDILWAYCGRGRGGGRRQLNCNFSYINTDADRCRLVNYIASSPTRLHSSIIILYDMCTYLMRILQF